MGFVVPHPRVIGFPPTLSGCTLSAPSATSAVNSEVIRTGFLLRRTSSFAEAMEDADGEQVVCWYDRRHGRPRLHQPYLTRVFLVPRLPCAPAEALAKAGLPWATPSDFVPFVCFVVPHPRFIGFQRSQRSQDETCNVATRSLARMRV